MFGKLQNILFFAFYLVSFQLTSTNSRTSTLWKLNEEETKIVEATPFRSVSFSDKSYFTEDDPIFNIITSTVRYGQSWVKEHQEEYFCSNCHTVESQKNYSTDSKISLKLNDVTDSDEALDCGTPLNYMPFDHLMGIANRHKHPNVPEPQVSLIFYEFKLNKDRYKDGNEKVLESEVDALERRLKKDKKMKPKSVKVYNQIGNFWRIKGEVQKAIECFRRALSVTPHDPNVLLNLARVLFTVHYFDDAILLIRMSLDAQTSAKETWQQHFTLGEIFKAYGHHDEALLHLRRTLDLNPSFKAAQVAIKEIEGMPVTRLHLYTFIIILSLVCGVLLVILSSIDTNIEEDSCDTKHQRQFTRTMAMSTLKGLRISSKTSRYRKISG